MNQHLPPAMEDYLEAIARLDRDEGAARVSHIARLLEVKNSSVNAAVASLAEKGLVVHEKYGYVELTPAGEKLAGAVQDRHDLLSRFLIEILGVKETTAREDACRMEHAISQETFDRLAGLMEFAGAGPGEKPPRWLENLRRHLEAGTASVRKKPGV